MKTRIIILLFIFFTLNSFMAIAQKKNNKTETFKVLGICEQCKDRIESTLQKLRTYEANWVIETNMLTVSYDSTRLTKEKIQQRLALVGHDTEKFQSTEEAYKKLPTCCLYDRWGAKKMNTDSNINSLTSVIRQDLQAITGLVLEEDKKGKMTPLPNATVKSLHSKQISITDSTGMFQLSGNVPFQIMVSYVGYPPDTITITSITEIKVILKNALNNQLKEIVVNSRNRATYVSTLSTLNTLYITPRELTKAACCNLSESFETSPSIDVSYADAVTGMKQIQLLGLSGNYTQLLTENTPEIRGLAGSYGLTFIPGPWLENIQVTKGTGSVVNGYESIAGQINIEEKKPDKMDKLFVNAYANNLGRLESSVNLSKLINDKWSTALLMHANGTVSKIDNNKDGFLDIPIGRQFNIINRWKYQDAKGVIAQFAIKALNDQRQAGEIGFNPGTDKLTTNRYGVGIDVQQQEFTGKLGYVFPQQKYKSLGFIFSAINYQNNSYYGLTKYDGKQSSLYANLIYQSIIGNSAHKFRTGMSFVNDQFTETINSTTYARRETVPGAFFEYTYSPSTKFTAIVGIREDYHNQFGLMTSPRLHIKYDISPKTNLRFSMGSGFRMANIFAENAGVFVSSRKYSIQNPTNNYGFGVDPEKALNYGVNFIHNFRLNNQSGSISIDAYRTDFTNQVVTDVDASPQKILFYNLTGKSFSNSVQFEVNYELIQKLEMRLAYRWLDVQTTYSNTLLEKPLVAKHRAFINLGYETNNHWKFDFTTQWLSKKRLPNTSSNPIDKQMGMYSPSFIQMSAQVSKQLGSKWDIYLGAENLTNYMQENLIISAAQPFSPYFDGSITWGPVNGRIVYVGMRFKIKN